MDYLKKLAKKIIQNEARLILKRYKPKIIAITGSVGKTLTREATYLVLSKKFFVRKSEKSFTAELGVPLTIIGCPQGKGSILDWVKNIFLGLRLLVFKKEYPEWLILEVDNDKPGDLQKVSSFLSPDILIMTAIGNVPAHIESFGGLEEFIEEKKYITNSVKRDGVIIYNIDDSRNSGILENVPGRKISCGMGGGCDVSGTNYKILYGNKGGLSVPTGMSFGISLDSVKEEVTVLGAVGVGYEYASLLSFAVGLELDINLDYIVKGLSCISPLPGRMNIISGEKETIIIDDSYNSSPTAMAEALLVFKDISSSGKKIVVFGDMLELGKYSADEHKKLASLMINGVTNVITVGIRTRKTAEELLSLGFPELNLISVDTSLEAGKELERILETRDIVLVKGSQGVRMEKVVEEVMRHPENKGKLLVRQEIEWLKRN